MIFFSILTRSTRSFVFDSLSKHYRLFCLFYVLYDLTVFVPCRMSIFVYVPNSANRFVRISNAKTDMYNTQYENWNRYGETHYIILYRTKEVICCFLIKTWHIYFKDLRYLDSSSTVCVYIENTEEKKVKRSHLSFLISCMKYFTSLHRFHIKYIIWDRILATFSNLFFINIVTLIYS